MHPPRWLPAFSVSFFLFSLLAMATPAYALSVAEISTKDGPPIHESHHYGAMSPGCDMGFDHPKQGRFSLYIAGTCTDSDRTQLSSCDVFLRGLVQDDYTHLSEMMACPFGAPGDTFYDDVYRNVGYAAEGY